MNHHEEIEIPPPDACLARQALLIPQAGTLKGVGINDGDVVLEIDGMRATPESFQLLGPRLSSGEAVQVRLFRAAKIVTLNVAAGVEPTLLATDGPEMACAGTHGYACGQNDNCTAMPNAWCLRTANGGCADCVETEFL